ncbi:MAG: phosphotransferase [Candidatus Poribacteria bacterium]|nr:phosphotransferase [Candidatus Poribacteria bacterium]
MATHSNTSFKNLVSAVQTILSKRFGGEVRLGKPENIHPQSLYRFNVLSGPDGIPASVFVKRKRARRICIEWACLQFLNDQATDENCPTPRFYGGGYIGKNNVPFVVMEDMGDGQNLRAILSADDSQTAKTVLIECAKMLGKIDALSIGRGEEFLKIRNSIIPIKQKSEDFHSVYTEKLTEICDAAGVTRHQESIPQLKSLVDFLDPFSRFHGLTHGDLYPVNVYQSTSKSRVYVFDYEFGHFQHILVDGFQIRVHLDVWAEVSRFPDDVMQEMEKTYRTAVATACPEIQDDEWFYQRLIEACVYETIRCIYRFFEPPKIVFSNVLNDRPAGDYEALRTDPNYNHWGLPAVRRRVFYRLGMLAQLTEEHNYLQALGATARKIQDKFSTIWPLEVREMPLYTAFL